MDAVLGAPLGTREVAEVLGLSPSSVSEWSLPVYKDTSGRQVHRFGDALTRMLGNLRSQIEASNETLTAARIRLANEQTEALRLENAKRRGELLPVGLVEKVWSDFAAVIRSCLDSIPAKVGLVLAATTDGLEAEEIVRRALHGAQAEVVAFDVDQYLDRIEEDDGDSNRPKNPKKAVRKVTAKPAKKPRAAKRGNGKRVGKRAPAAKP